MMPNPACSGHGFAVGEPWGLVGQSSIASNVEGRHRRAADAIVRPSGFFDGEGVKIAMA